MRPSILRCTLSLLLFLLGSHGDLLAQSRVALCIGVNDYNKSVPHLESPRRDAVDLAMKLQELRFSVQKVGLDSTKGQMVTSITNFLAAAKNAELAVFYFSGHGLQVGDENFLLPSSFQLPGRYDDLKEQAVSLTDLLMVPWERATQNDQTKVILLDCCRDNGLKLDFPAPGNEEITNGAGKIEGYGPGFFLAFATSPRNVAFAGGAQSHSPFTECLLEQLEDKAGESLRDLLDFTKASVLKKFGDRQVPWVNESLDTQHAKVLAPHLAKAKPKFRTLDAAALAKIEIQDNVRELLQLYGEPQFQHAIKITQEEGPDVFPCALDLRRWRTPEFVLDLYTEADKKQILTMVVWPLKPGLGYRYPGYGFQWALDGRSWGQLKKADALSQHGQLMVGWDGRVPCFLEKHYFGKAGKYWDYYFVGKVPDKAIDQGLGFDLQSGRRRLADYLSGVVPHAVVITTGPEGMDDMGKDTERWDRTITLLAGWGEPPKY